MTCVSLLALHRTVMLSGVRYELVVWEHLAAALLGLGLLAAALRVHGRIGRSPLLAGLLALGALGMATMLMLAGRGYSSPRPDVLYALGYGVCCACAYLFAVFDPEPPPPGGSERDLDPPPWWPQFERDLHDYLRGRGRAARRERPRLPVA
jgi:hypothetical protein